MKTGIYYWFGYPIESRRRFELIRAAGFDSVMLWWGDEYKDIDGDKNILPDLARAYGLEVENIHAPFDTVNEIWKDNIDGKEVMDLYIKCIDDCARHNISTVVLHITTGKNPPPVTKLGIERFKDIVDYSQNKGIYIALENLRRHDYLNEIFMNIDSPYLGFCYDSGHEKCYSVV
ncbi:TIM barrel protein [Proteiniborus sp.]|uniref:sugar phosphate isomerase/epimerase family protein n=1 Tax=Proteiniborus sp. TaxID=2079015 RepID=UPI0033251CD1